MTTAAPPYLAHTLYHDVVDLKKLAFLFREIEKLGPPPLEVLEVGCGSGNIALPLASLGHRVRATDIDPVSVDFARRRSSFPNLTLEVAGLEDMGPAARWDAIIASEVLEHVGDPAGALDRFRSALKPRGVLLVTIPNGYGPWEAGQALSPRRLAGSLARRLGIHGALKRAAGLKPEERGGETSTFNYESPHLQHFTLRRFERQAQAAGFDVVRRVHSDGPLTFFSGVRRFSALARFDCALADHLPAALASGWYFVLRPRSSPPTA
jgi:2-polyprenyl-3-methyl-5-hydroxy-6-metoxy-1,4-benzoquinol methylase